MVAFCQAPWEDVDSCRMLTPKLWLLLSSWTVRGQVACGHGHWGLAGPDMGWRGLPCVCEQRKAVNTLVPCGIGRQSAGPVGQTTVAGGDERPSRRAVTKRQNAGASRIRPAGLPCSELLPELLHVVWGVSKDLCASGLRMGCLHSRNAALNQAMDNLGFFCAASAPSQWALAELMEDRAWVAAFRAENARRLREAYEGLRGALAAAGIPHVESTSALFTWIDLRAWLDEPTWAAEVRLWEEVCRECLTPGEQCHAPEPGYFRVCWAWVPPSALPVAVQRLQEYLAAKQRQVGQQQPEQLAETVAREQHGQQPPSCCPCPSSASLPPFLSLPLPLPRALSISMARSGSRPLSVSALLASAVAAAALRVSRSNSRTAPGAPRNVVGYAERRGEGEAREEGMELTGTESGRLAEALLWLSRSGSAPGDGLSCPVGSGPWGDGQQRALGGALENTTCC